jgi:hypothetical protein
MCAPGSQGRGSIGGGLTISITTLGQGMAGGSAAYAVSNALWKCCWVISRVQAVTHLYWYPLSRHVWLYDALSRGVLVAAATPREGESYLWSLGRWVSCLHQHTSEA